jgi:hypothetical protein
MTAPSAPPRLKINPVRGRRPVLQNFTVSELQIDPRYQRSIETGPSQSLIRRIARDWDWRLCQPLLVAGRGDEGLFVVDGQHRLAAARLRGDIGDLPCVMISWRDANEEASAFVELNRARKPLGALDLFRASLAGADPDALALRAMIEEVGLSIAPHTNPKHWRPGMLHNISGIQKCLRLHGEEITRRTLRILAQSFAGEVLQYAGTLFAGLYPLLATLGDDCDDGLMIMVLQGASQADWLKDIAAIEVERGIHRSKATAEVIRIAYLDALAEDQEAAE